MSERRHTVENVHRVFHRDGDGAFVEVGPDGDGVGCVEIRTTGKPSEEFFGAVRLVLDPGMARLVADALRRAADEIETSEAA